MVPVLLVYVKWGYHVILSIYQIAEVIPMRDDKEISIVEYQTKEYGEIRLTVKEAMDKRKMSRRRLATLSGLKYDTVHNYYMGKSSKKSTGGNNAPLMRVDLTTLAKMCFCLQCGIDELIQYVPPEK